MELTTPKPTPIKSTTITLFLVFVRRLCSQIPEEWLQRSSPEDDLLTLVREICEYCLRYSAEAEACDLLMEIEKIEMIVDLVTEDISDRVCLYLTR